MLLNLLGLQGLQALQGFQTQAQDPMQRMWSHLLLLVLALASLTARAL